MRNHLSRSLIESGLLDQGDGVGLPTPLDALDIPATVQGVLLARIDRLPEALKEVLQRAAVIGRVFTHPVLNHMADQGAPLESILEQLEKLEFIYPTSLAPPREYSFKHVLTQEVVYQTLLRPRRETYHERVGQAIEALYSDHLEEYYDLLAYHYDRGNNADKAVAYLELANQKAMRANAMEEAKTYFDAAMAHLDSLPDIPTNQQRRVTLLVNQGVAMVQLLRMPEYHDLLIRYESVALGLDDQGLADAFQGRIGFCRWSFGDFDEAILILTQAARMCEATGNTEDAGQAYNHLLWSHYLQANYDQAFTVKDAFLRTLEHGGFNLRWYLYILTASSLAHACLGLWDEAIDEASRPYAWEMSFRIEARFRGAISCSQTPTCLRVIGPEGWNMENWHLNKRPHLEIEYGSKAFSVRRCVEVGSIIAPWNC